jgi:hypothetical protein
MRLRLLGIALAMTLLAGHARSAVASDPIAAPANRASWSEIRWPFLIDEWGTGRAFQCKASDCGEDVSLYLRVKAGFCNCATGVADDDDLDRVGDISLLSNRFVGLASGRPVDVAGMTGRSRPYAVSLPLWRKETAVAVVLHAKCDAVVATILADRDRLGSAEREALAFLARDQVLQWTRVTLGL